ncbi:MAG: DNA mismatch repair protein MutS [Myxococcaceae bacterium]|nr:DNA mismatch repair protein MutS [Myxococcaceae bacterium]
MHAPMSLEPAEPQGTPPVVEVELNEKQLTPMMKQYLEAKAQHPGAILFFRLGDFYEMFFEDAVKASEILHITLTARSKGDDKVPMAGVPYHSARRYVARLIRAGHTVAICEQTSEAGGPGIVRREVVRVVTPGTVLDEELLEASENHYLAAVAPPAKGDARWGAALLDGTTGELDAIAPCALGELAEALGRAAPKELLVPEGADGPSVDALLELLPRRPSVARVAAETFERPRAEALLKAHLKVASLDGFGLDRAPASLGPCAAALRYLQDTQKTPAAHVVRARVVEAQGGLVLDEASRANLELVRSLKDQGRTGTLLSVIDRTVTSGGARALHRWLLSPLNELAAITARHDAVDELLRAQAFRETMGALLKDVGDIERLTARLSLASGGPRDLGALGRSLAQVAPLAKALQGVKSPLIKALLPSLEDRALHGLAATLQKAIVDEPKQVVADGGFIRPGFNAELDGYVALATNAKDTLLKLEAREKAATQIGSLKVRYNKVFGYYLEVTKANLHLVPKGWIRKQTTVGAERFVTEELKQFEEQVLTADEKRLALELRLFDELRALVLSHAAALRTVAESLAVLDVLRGFAQVAAELRYVRPSMHEGFELEIEGGRHPVVELSLGKGEAFVPNDVRLDRETAQLMVITGPNMAGKSTVMRQVALTVVLAQAGAFVPAKAARLGLCDRVFTRVGASDNLARGQSTFMVEMAETANILHHATKRSLVVLDEIGRGTSTFDGLSIAWAVAEHLVDRVGARTMFATHYHELTDLARERPKVKNCSIAVREANGKVTFLRKLCDGAASKSYGIEVAKLAGLPLEVLARARELLKNLESGEFDEAGRPRLARRAQPDRAAPAPVPATSQLGLFGAPAAVNVKEAAVADAVLRFSVDGATPLEALNAIARWQAELRAKGE